MAHHPHTDSDSPAASTHTLLPPFGPRKSRRMLSADFYGYISSVVYLCIILLTASSLNTPSTPPAQFPCPSIHHPRLRHGYLARDQVHAIMSRRMSSALLLLSLGGMPRIGSEGIFVSAFLSCLLFYAILARLFACDDGTG